MVDPGIVPDSHLRQPEVGPFPVCPGTMSSMTMPPCAAATSHRRRNSTSVPNTPSIWVLIRSKCPSTLGVASQPKTPPARFRGPVCTALMPIASNASHSSSSPKVLRKERPGLVIIEMG